MNFCNKPIKSRSKYSDIYSPCCHKIQGHSQKCEEYPFLNHLKKIDKRVADKIKRDATMTTGAAWKSEDAGPNRILRWVMLLEDEQLLDYGINMTELKPQVIDKLREKAADYNTCVLVAAKLTWLVYQMIDAPIPPREISEYLESLFGPLKPATTVCVICKLPLSYKLFSVAERGKAAIETCHKNPRIHNPENIGFGHRECNIAQGSKSLSEFYSWIQDILKRLENSKSK